MTMILEIRKAGFENKGAAMMLLAAMKQLRHRFPDPRIVVAPDYTTPYELRSAHQIWHRAELIRGGIDLGAALQFVPRKLRERYGFVVNSQVQVVLDAAGLAYSDAWGPDAAADLARRSINWRRQNKKLILLPQAFGPFTNAKIRSSISTIVDHADLIFARDSYSLAHLEDVVGVRENIRLAPDFTNILEPVISKADKRDQKKLAIVPNARMLDKVGTDNGNDYLKMLDKVARISMDLGVRPFFLIHEGQGDLDIAEQLNTHFKEPLEIWKSDDTLAAKAKIKECGAVVGSRFHALVSALSQAVPAIGTGWNHKYQALFEDYGCSELLVEVNVTDEELRSKITGLFDEKKRSSITRLLESNSEKLKKKTKNMWDEVFNIIDER